MNDLDIVERLDHQLDEIESNGVKWLKPIIEFTQYDEMIERANEVADYLKSVEVTEDNIKESKKLLAKARAITKALSDRRIAIKKDITEPIVVFENQIKEISKIVDDADAIVREQVSELEEREREQKEQTLKSIFEERSVDYTFPELKPNCFEDCLTRQMLNKSTSIKQCEDMIVQWFEKTEQDITTIRLMEDSEDILTDYLETLDMNISIQRVKNRKSIKETVSKLASNDSTVSINEPRAMFQVKGDKDIALTRMWLKTNNIDFFEVIG